jgi:hypothetical protein
MKREIVRELERAGMQENKCFSQTIDERDREASAFRHTKKSRSNLSFWGGEHE